MRERVREALGHGRSIRKRGLTVVEIMNAIHAGKIQGMYIMGENPAMSDPDVHHAREALAKLEHLVVQDIFLTETACYADVDPAGLGVCRKRPAPSPTPTARCRWAARRCRCPARRARICWIIQEIAKRSASTGTIRHPARGVCRDDAGHAVARQHHLGAARARKRGHLSRAMADDEPGNEIVFGDGFPTESGRGKLVPADVRAAGRSCRTPNIRWCSRPAASSSIGIPAR